MTFGIIHELQLLTPWDNQTGVGVGVGIAVTAPGYSGYSPLRDHFWDKPGLMVALKPDLCPFGELLCSRLGPPPLLGAGGFSGDLRFLASTV